MTDKILIDSYVVEQALEALDEIAWSNNTRQQSDRADDARIVLRAALEQPQDHPEQNLDMVPAGWKLVPVEPTEAMLHAGNSAIENWGVDANGSSTYRAMLAAAPQPQSSTPWE